MNSAAGKVALITGAAGAIGLAMAKELLRHNAKGIVLVDISDQAGAKALNELRQTFGDDKAIFVKTNVTVKKELEDAFEAAVKFYRQLDIVINSVGVLDEFQWEKTLAINLTSVIEATYLALKTYLPKYKSGEEAVIVNVASTLGLESWQLSPVYCTTKHGLVGLGQALGGYKVYETYKVRVLTICPGIVDTPLELKMLFPEIKDELIKQLYPITQTAEHVAEALTEVIKNGKNGSLWVIEEDTPAYEVAIPHRKTIRVTN